PRNDAGEESPVRYDFRFSIFDFRIAVHDWPEAQRVQAKLRTRAHGKNVANDSADARGCALEWFNRAGMIVALHLERDRPAIADINYARIFFAGFNQNVRASRGKLLQFFHRIFVRAVLAPHNRENSQLGEVWFAPEDLLDSFEFFRRQTVLLHEFGCNRWI